MSKTKFFVVVKIVTFSAALVVQQLSLIFALSFKFKTNILIELLSIEFKHKARKFKKHLLKQMF